MTDDTYIIPVLEPTEALPRRFPVVAQLLVLGTLFLGIFGFAIFTPGLWLKDKVATLPTPIAPLVVATDDTKIIPALDTVSVVARSAYVYDVRTKRALYNKDADHILPLASVTKLMTALIAHELVDGEKTVTVPKSAVLQSGTSGLAEGEQFTSQALADYAVLASSNDAAYALANAVGAMIDTTNPNQTFVQAMNLRATELGLLNLKFSNPTGLDLSPTEAGAVGTAREVSFLMEYILTNYPSILEPTTLTSTRVYNEGGAYHEAENTNPIVARIPNLLGSKTGYTDLAGGNLTIAFDAGYNRPIIVTVLGSTYDGRFSDALALIDAIVLSLAAE
jgi:D-alanyl-D-alanine carboxypeptidase (penicillin-binding protein 5/6)